VANSTISWFAEGNPPILCYLSCISCQPMWNCRGKAPFGSESTSIFGRCAGTLYLRKNHEPSLRQTLCRVVEKNHIAFEVLSDVGNHVARDFGLVLTLSEKLRPIYASFGIDIPAFNGDDTFELPMPATYVIDTDGIITYAFVDPDYTKRLEPSQIVNVLKNMTVEK